MKTLDDAVIELNGVWPATDCKFMHEFISKDIHGCNNYRDSSFCTREQFQQRAKELGFVNGYRYGVEYKTDGKRPDLPDDVVIGIDESDYPANTVDSWVWSKVKLFMITDQRYKPADTSYLEKPDSSASTGRVEVDMIAQAKHEFSAASRAFQDLFKESFDKVIDKMEKERKSIAERNKVVDAAYGVVGSKGWLEMLYDNGFLKLPE